ncbi:short-chain dehydrogenase reductase, putative [Ichthyophthirius multifiliis]|uniref:Short-chain dehydrogenase reductase, putative n=1 Tax=Ichthyophthirius multifiliis TaxID=5932 RepID=G0QJM9_ICHMU|nr:short-chain dehydrogenase reductase, putative [Ichthyophthirius multifiliis]EGR34579.1 short-chain dehydrogenase reductase, putative [Ichthyophthirius multifiliis]|eukprot:XP_004039883.1 short-chain dehydrogenase reductase, putative [Ichthyophthirius multifiliis]
MSKNLIKFIFSLFRKQNNFIKSYGKDTYALITGSSDGIGKQFAIEMAKSGMNLILIARNEQKLNNVKN